LAGVSRTSPFFFCGMKGLYPNNANTTTHLAISKEFNGTSVTNEFLAQ
jgi:hypothetical protein